MAVITGNFPTGPYTATYKSADIGLMEGPIRHQQSLSGLPIRASVWGRNVLDYILDGGAVFAVVVVKEWDAGSKAFIHPFFSTIGMGDYPEAGVLFNQYCGSLILTALPNTPAATEGPVTRTYGLCALLPGHNLDVPLGVVERNVPVVIVSLPQPVSGGSYKPRYFADT